VSGGPPVLLQLRSRGLLETSVQRGIVGSTNYDGGGIVKMRDEWTGSSFSAVPNHVLTPFYADVSRTLSSY